MKNRLRRCIAGVLGIVLLGASIFPSTNIVRAEQGEAEDNRSISAPLAQDHSVVSTSPETSEEGNLTGGGGLRH